MSLPVCPQCGATQQWEMWRNCQCGYDFGPPKAAPRDHDDSASAQSKYQTFWPRFVAGFWDGIIFIPLNYINVYLLSPHRDRVTLVIWSVVAYTACWLYSVLLHARYGQTLGKMLANVKVLDLSESRIPTFRQAFLRDIGYIVLSTLSLAWLLYLIFSGQYVKGGKVASWPGVVLYYSSFGWFLLEFITMLTNAKRRALHDFIAGTVVVRNDSKPMEKPPAA